MEDLGLKTFNKLYPMMIRKYKDLIVDQNANEADKINQIISKLNALGKLSNDVVRDWNTVYQWAMNDGLTTDVSNKLEQMLANGEFQGIIDQVLLEIGSLPSLHTTVKDTLVNSINEVDDLAKANQTKLGDLTTLQTTDKDTIVHAINDNVVSLAQSMSQKDSLAIDVTDKRFGAKGDGITDDTLAIQAAIDSITNGTIILPAGKTFLIDATKYVTGGVYCGIKIYQKSNITFLCYGTIQVKTNNFDNACAVSIAQSTNIKIVNPTIIGDRDTHTGSTGENGHGINITNSDEVYIYQPNISKTWGDGIYIGVDYGGTSGKASGHIAVYNPLIQDCSRNGISCCSGDFIEIHSPIIRRIDRTAPKSGFDIEPEGVGNPLPILNKLLITDPVIEDCGSNDVVIGLYNLLNRALYTDIQIKGAKLKGSNQGILVYGDESHTGNALGGQVVFENAHVRNSNYSGVYIKNWTKNLPTLKFIKPLIVDVNVLNNASTEFGSCFAIVGNNIATYNIDIDNIVIERPIFRETRATKQVLRPIAVFTRGVGNLFKVIEPLENSISFTTSPSYNPPSITLNYNGSTGGDNKMVMTDPFGCFAAYTGGGDINVSSGNSITEFHNSSDNPTDARTLNLKTTYPENSSVRFVKRNSGGSLTITPDPTQNILPISSVAGKYIQTTQQGASVAMKRMGTSWIIVSMNGTWTAQP